MAKNKQYRSTGSLILEMIDNFDSVESKLLIVETMFYLMIDNQEAVDMNLQISAIGDNIDYLKRDLKRYRRLLNKTLKSL